MKRRPFFTILTIIVFAGVFFACGQDESKTELPPGTTQIIGAGATFPAPLYKKWITEYHNKHKDVVITYEVVGSGEGTKRFMADTVDFGASDAAMKDEQMAEVQRGVQLIPVTAGTIVLAYNLPGVQGDLKLSRQLYVDIFLGKVLKWNDASITELNPDLKFPNKNITMVVRSDSSGTTWAFTNHLSSISDEWRDKGPGTGKRLDWPGNTMAARGNEGVASKIQLSVGSIGYVEYGYAKRAGLSMALLENKAGHFIKPDDLSGTHTLANMSTQMPENLRMFMPDPDGDDSYTIVTYSWLLLYKSYEDKAKADKLKDFVTWSLKEGQQYGLEFGYAPLPQNVADRALQALSSIQ